MASPNSSAGSSTGRSTMPHDARVAAGSARSLLLTILGDMVLPSQEPAWTSSFLYVMSGVGVTEKTARQAISRTAAKGWLEAQRDGREVRWHITPPGQKMIEEGARRVYSLSSGREDWNGDWLVLLVTVPSAKRHLRRKLYRALSWIGFGNPTPGTWLTPNTERAGEARRVVRELGLVESCLAFCGPSAEVGLDDVELVDKSWDLDAIAEHYRESLDRFADATPETADEVLFSYVSLVNEWQRFPYIDPTLPDVLLPPRWVGRRAPKDFERIRAEWSEEAFRRWLEINSRA